MRACVRFGAGRAAPPHLQAAAQLAAPRPVEVWRHAEVKAQQAVAGWQAGRHAAQLDATTQPAGGRPAAGGIAHAQRVLAPRPQLSQACVGQVTSVPRRTVLHKRRRQRERGDGAAAGRLAGSAAWPTRRPLLWPACGGCLRCCLGCRLLLLPLQLTCRGLGRTLLLLLLLRGLPRGVVPRRLLVGRPWNLHGRRIGLLLLLLPLLALSIFFSETPAQPKMVDLASFNRRSLTPCQVHRQQAQVAVIAVAAHSWQQQRLIEKT